MSTYTAPKFLRRPLATKRGCGYRRAAPLMISCLQSHWPRIPGRNISMALKPARTGLLALPRLRVPCARRRILRRGTGRTGAAKTFTATASIESRLARGLQIARANPSTFTAAASPPSVRAARCLVRSRRDALHALLHVARSVRRSSRFLSGLPLPSRLGGRSLA